MSGLICVALIPARGGSKRIPGKNTKLLGGHPLIAYTIAAAKQSGVFAGVFVSTDSPDVKLAVRGSGVCTIDRPAAFGADESPDIQWVEHALDETYCVDAEPDCFAILRPTSPFRPAGTIRRAWEQWCELGQHFDSLRAVEPVRQHPCKMWRLIPGGIDPLCGHTWNVGHGAPHHSSPTQMLEPLYVQNASLEIAWVSTVTQQHSISGELVMPFLTEGYEGFDLNDLRDWAYAEWLVESGRAKLPEVT